MRTRQIAAGILVLAAVLAGGCRGPAPVTRPTVVVGASSPEPRVVEAADALRYARGVDALGKIYRRTGEYLQAFLAREAQAYALGSVSAADHATMRTEVKYLALSAISFLDTLKYTLDGGMPGPSFDAWQAERLFADFALRVTAEHPTLHTELTTLAERVRGAFFVIASIPWEPRPEGVPARPIETTDRAAVDAAGAKGGSE